MSSVLPPYLTDRLFLDTRKHFIVAKIEKASPEKNIQNE